MSEKSQRDVHDHLAATSIEAHSLRCAFSFDPSACAYILGRMRGCRKYVPRASLTERHFHPAKRARQLIAHASQRSYEYLKKPPGSLQMLSSTSCYQSRSSQYETCMSIFIFGL